jgi:hypothetical protein
MALVTPARSQRSASSNVLDQRRLNKGLESRLV